MHSRDPQKSDSEFQQEFERILTEATDRNKVADFTRFIFPSAEYAHREFKTRCWFDYATFTQKADFSNATFRNATFSHATFTENTSFYCARFEQIAYFYGVGFTKEANFCRAMFMQGADFSDATFTQNAIFLCAEFTQRAKFEKTTFAELVHFNQAQFSVSAAFRETIFRGDRKLKPEADDTLPGPVFSLAQFSHPEAIVFYKTYLGQALFHNCDVSGVTFSSVTWRKRKPGGKSMVLEEEKKFSLDRAVASALRPGPDSHDERDYGLIAELYQQLKKNYDDRRDYWTAGDFHYGEMEMKRLHSRSRWPWVRWLHQYLGLVAWYKYFSCYGESYVRPLWLLAAVLVAFVLLYPLAGLRTTPPVSTTVTQQAPPPMPATELSYCHFAEFIRAHPGSRWSGGKKAFFGHSLMTTLSVTSLQKGLGYEPVYPWGRALALLQLLLTSTLIALFLLALRRQFKR